MPQVPMTTAAKAAEAVLAFCNDHGDLVTNLKLQKVLYYLQGWHLGEYGVPLFPEPFQAWILGPVCEPVYQAYRPFGYRAIEVDADVEAVEPALLEHVADIWQAYGSLSAYDLERLAQSEPPWQKARAGLRRDEPSYAVITQADMREFFAAEAMKSAS